MEKVSCPNCKSMKIFVKSCKEENYLFEEKTEYLMGIRAIAKKKRMLRSYEKVTEYKCRKCGECFTHREKVNIDRNT